MANGYIYGGINAATENLTRWNAQREREEMAKEQYAAQQKQQQFANRMAEQASARQQASIDLRRQRYGVEDRRYDAATALEAERYAEQQRKAKDAQDKIDQLHALNVAKQSQNLAEGVGALEERQELRAWAKEARELAKVRDAYKFSEDVMASKRKRELHELTRTERQLGISKKTQELADMTKRAQDLTSGKEGLEKMKQAASVTNFSNWFVKQADFLAGLGADANAVIADQLTKAGMPVDSARLLPSELVKDVPYPGLEVMINGVPKTFTPAQVAAFQAGSPEYLREHDPMQLQRMYLDRLKQMVDIRKYEAELRKDVPEGRELTGSFKDAMLRQMEGDMPKVPPTWEPAILGLTKRAMRSKAMEGKDPETVQMGILDRVVKNNDLLWQIEDLAAMADDDPALKKKLPVGSTRTKYMQELENQWSKAVFPPIPTDQKILGVLNAHKKKNFVQRIMTPQSQPQLRLQDGTMATHLMEYGEADGKFVVYPTIIQDERGQLQNLGSADAWKHAKETGEFIPFGTEAEAASFSAHYKDVWKIPGGIPDTPQAGQEPRAAITPDMPVIAPGEAALPPTQYAEPHWLAQGWYDIERGQEEAQAMPATEQQKTEAKQRQLQEIEIKKHRESVFADNPKLLEAGTMYDRAQILRNARKKAKTPVQKEAVRRMIEENQRAGASKETPFGESTGALGDLGAAGIPGAGGDIRSRTLARLGLLGEAGQTE
jgi:hypothetical protein